MLRLAILALSLLITSGVQAEQWVCFDATTKYVNRVVEGDGVKLGICGENNSNVISTCIMAQGTEFTDAKAVHKKVNTANAAGTRVIDWTQAEIDTETSANASANVTNTRDLAQGDVDNFNADGVRLRAALIVVKNEINILRQKLSILTDELLLEGLNITDVDLADRTTTQIKTSIKGEITNGNAD